MTAIPVIGLDGDEVKVASEISRACTEVGFFVVRDHGIDRKVFDDAYEESMGFFRRPVAQKNSYPMRTSTAGGQRLQPLRLQRAACGERLRLHRQARHAGGLRDRKG